MPYTCETCNVTVKNSCHINRHLKSEKHKKSIEVSIKKDEKQTQDNHYKEGLNDYIKFMNELCK